MNGTEFSRLVSTKIDKAYSDYWNTTKRNDIIQEAFIKAIEIKYKGLTSQENTDEMYNLIRTSVPYTPVANQINLLTGITDYLHLLALKVKNTKFNAVNVTGATNTSPIVLTVNGQLDLRSGDLATIVGVGGNSAANGDRYVKRGYEDFEYNKFTYTLYQNEKLTIPITGNGVFTNGGTIQRVIYTWAKKKDSFRKYAKLGEPTVHDPYYEEADGFLKLLPINEPATEVLIDYIKKITVPIDVTDAVVDLENTYPLRFLYFLADETAKLLTAYARDFQATEFEQNEIITQP